MSSGLLATPPVRLSTPRIGNPKTYLDGKIQKYEMLEHQQALKPASGRTQTLDDLHGAVSSIRADNHSFQTFVLTELKALAMVAALIVATMATNGKLLDFLTPPDNVE